MRYFTSALAEVRGRGTRGELSAPALSDMSLATSVEVRPPLRGGEPWLM